MQFSNGGMPIPGENFTSDTKNYPWHQPPEHKSVTDALDKMSIKLTEPKNARHVMAFAEAGFPLVRIAQMIIMEGVAQGKWTVDMGLLLAGPFTKIFEIMCDSYDIKYDIGIAEEDNWQTGNYYKAVSTLQEDAGKLGNAGDIIQEKLPEIEAAADAQASPDSGAQDQGGQSPAPATQDLGAQGFASMTGSDPTKKGK